jgi:hypothetical protein
MTQPSGHEHTIDVPVLIGPLALRVVLLTAVCTVAGFAMLRAFLGPPGRTTTTVVTVSAAAATVLELMLAGGFDLPDQAAVLILAGIAVPLVLAMSRNPGATRLAERAAPWVLGIAAGAAFVEFARAKLTGGLTTIPVHTGLMLALVGLSWYTLGLPRWRPGSLAVQIMATTLATVTIGGIGAVSAFMSGP